MRLKPISWQLLFALMGLSFSAACSGPDADSPRYDASRTFRGEVNLEIGEVEGEESYLFGSVTGIAQDPRGRVYVADGQANEVRVFDAGGSFLFRVGAEGEGPGELRGPCCLAIGSAGRLWVRETGNARYSSFDIQAAPPRFDRSVRMHHNAANMWAPITFDRQGRLVDVGMETDASGSSTRVRLHTTLAGVVDTTILIPAPPQREVGAYEVTRKVGQNLVKFYLHQPFGSRHLVTHGRGGQWAQAVSSAYRVEWHQGDGRLRIISEPDGPGLELTEEERRNAQAEIDRDRERLRLGPGEMPYGVPARKPPLRKLFFGTDGRLWVELNVGVDERGADVYEPSGKLVGRFEWPARVSSGVTTWVGTLELVGVTRDSLDVLRVARVSFERSR